MTAQQQQAFDAKVEQKINEMMPYLVRQKKRLNGGMESGERQDFTKGACWRKLFRIRFSRASFAL